jgi:predicted secreted hydrolase
MKKSLLFFMCIAGLAGLFTIMLALKKNNKLGQVSSSLVAQAAPASIAGYTRAEGPRDLVFPDDNGPHPEYQTEWWYFTGNLDAEDGQHFGYQLTFFRRALFPQNLMTQRASDWATNQVYLAHFAVTDVKGKRYQAFERLSRGAVGLAGAQAQPFQVWLDDWTVKEIDPGTYKLSARQGDLSIDLKLADVKGPILQGDQGYSQKGPESGNASYYVSNPRLTSQGTIRVDSEEIPVQGLSWVDHEWSTSVLSKDQVGWDWFSLQLDNGDDLMLFQIRKDDGTVDPFSSGILIKQDGQTQKFTRDEFIIQALGDWKSPHNEAVYPAGWKVEIPSIGASLELLPYLADQELNLSYTYWEGAVRISGKVNNQPVSGNGYTELTGYSGSMGGEF